MRRLTVSIRRGVLLAGLAAAVLLGGGPVRAQTRTPSENGGIVDGQRREPNPAVVAPAERRSGVAPSPAQTDQNAGAVEQLNRDLLGKEQASPPTQSSIPAIQDGNPSGSR